MKTIILLTMLLLNSGQGLSPCEAIPHHKAKSKQPLSLKDPCRVEQRLALLREDMSTQEVLKTLGIWKHRKKLTALWHGGFTYCSVIGEDYRLTLDFLGYPDTKLKLKRAKLISKDNKVIKSVDWL